MNINSFNPNLPSNLSISHSQARKKMSGSASSEARGAEASSMPGDVVKPLTAALNTLPEVREEMVQKGNRLLGEPDFPSQDQITDLARLIARNPLPTAE